MEQPRKKGKISIFLKRSDIYAQTIGPTFNGLRYYPTKCGGWLTILSVLIVVGYFAAQVGNIVLYKYPKVNSRTQQVDQGVWNITS